ncbi:hypothetical protein [Gardnerella leopoldii]|uniref:hypothetical protein n=1 Tax=Gardnerella leopoldii TaxID=2792978 RepID=UPI00397070DD
MVADHMAAEAAEHKAAERKAAVEQAEHKAAEAAEHKAVLDWLSVSLLDWLSLRNRLSLRNLLVIFVHFPSICKSNTSNTIPCSS